MAENEDTGDGIQDEYPEFAWGFIGMKAGQQYAIKGRHRFPDLASARDTLFLMAMRDSRLLEARLMDGKTGEILWAVLPGIVRMAMERAGWTLDILMGLPPPGVVPRRPDGR